MAVTLTSDPIVTAQRVADVLNVSGDEITHYINAASFAFLRYTGRSAINQQEVTDYLALPPAGAPVVYLRAAPVDTGQDITLQVYYDGSLFDTIGSGEYVLIANTGRLELRENTVRGLGFGYRLHATYTGGWASVPDDIQQSALELIGWYKARAHGGAGVTAEGVEGQTVSYERASLPTSVREVWDRYRIF